MNLFDKILQKTTQLTQEKAEQSNQSAPVEHSLWMIYDTVQNKASESYVDTNQFVNALNHVINKLNFRYNAQIPSVDLMVNISAGSNSDFDTFKDVSIQQYIPWDFQQDIMISWLTYDLYTLNNGISSVGSSNSIWQAYQEALKQLPRYRIKADTTLPRSTLELIPYERPMSVTTSSYRLFRRRR